MIPPTPDTPDVEAIPPNVEDSDWALERVRKLCASAFVDASVYRKKLLKGFGYPNETFRAAQDARALSIVLALLNQQAAALRACQQERDKLLQGYDYWKQTAENANSRVSAVIRCRRASRSASTATQ